MKIKKCHYKTITFMDQIGSLKRIHECLNIIHNIIYLYHCRHSETDLLDHTQ